MKQVSLRASILAIVGTLLALVLANSVTVAWLGQRTTGLVSSVLEESSEGLEAARGLENALAAQEDLLAACLLGGDRSRTNRIHDLRRDLDAWLKKARNGTRGGERHEILNEIEAMAVRCGVSQDRIMELIAAGDRGTAIRLGEELSMAFQDIRGLCDRFAALSAKDIARSRSAAASGGRAALILAVGSLCAAAALGLVLTHLIFKRILKPLSDLAAKVDPGGAPSRTSNEVEALVRSVDGLLEDVVEKKTELAVSRERLLQSEKLAMVGKLAASVAHTIRNPLTSVKMRLFSLERSLDLAPAEKEDFDVISEEIRHIDTIVQNFLEFSRPPKLKMQSVSPSDVVDMAIQLLRRRIESYGVTLELFRQRKLSKVKADPEQLKEVLVNLIINACEAMGEGGKIEILEEEGKTEPIGHVAVIRVIDNGPGMPESIREKVFQPFFSTKEEGTGLGLSIAARIIEDHHGCLNLRSREGKGTTFTITIPCVEEGAWLRS